MGNAVQLAPPDPGDPAGEEPDHVRAGLVRATGSTRIESDVAFRGVALTEHTDFVDGQPGELVADQVAQLVCGDHQAVRVYPVHVRG